MSGFKDMATEIEHKAAELKNNETIGGLSKCHVDRRRQGDLDFSFCQIIK
jgi:hypothetical protein